MSQPDHANPLTTEETSENFLSKLANLGLRLFCLILLVVGVDWVFRALARVGNKHLVVGNCDFTPGFLTTMGEVWIGTTLIVLMLIALDIRRTHPLSLKLRMSIGAALFAAMTITSAGYYAGTVDHSAWRLDDQMVCHERSFVGCTLRF